MLFSRIIIYSIIVLISFILHVNCGHHKSRQVSTTTITRNDTITEVINTQKSNESQRINDLNVTALDTYKATTLTTTTTLKPNQSQEEYSKFNKSCYHCLYEHQLENTIHALLQNDSFRINPGNKSCVQCLDMDFSKNIEAVECMCGVYTTENPSLYDVPLRTKWFQNVSCHELVPFKEACKKICVLATLSYNELDAEVLCHHLTTANKVKAYVESKLCGENTQWVFTGLASSTPVCCDKGKPVECSK